MRLNITVDKRSIPVFLTLLQEGVTLNGNIGASVRDTIKEHLDITDEYIDKKISTVLLDSSVVDDMDRAVIKEGSVLALSGAMPGLVGATMRTHSFYASFRNAITYREKQDAHKVKQGRFHIKLFNVLLKELGPKLLKKGILVDSAKLYEILNAQSEKTAMDIKEVSLDDVSLDLDKVNKILMDNDKSMIELAVNCL
ncbi:MAG TPA: hypothetical protein PK864_11125 [Syntrophorhabdaceae bacterium]|nr:hypothetical protein [Syntrophorhabdaceae bacterium]HOT42183.1 hypothetical protein [Syntrophorhabdaceae bacterium]HPC66852.1 hypothetical protein [Syntrophorhabdaceae bacterium]HQH42985.1 hypothetical protein [Syntrophorhabdaceae bacterium]HQK45910.1 hypothetical protein [Syntrophorhabdaceae bacterium]